MSAPVAYQDIWGMHVEKWLTETLVRINGPLRGKLFMGIVLEALELSAMV